MVMIGHRHEKRVPKLVIKKMGYITINIMIYTIQGLQKKLIQKIFR